MKNTILLTFAVIWMGAASLSFAQSSSTTSDTMKPNIGAPRAVLPKLESDNESYVACYFRNPDRTVSWQWGLRDKDTYYKFQGYWKITGYTKLQKFFTSSEKIIEAIKEVCNVAKTYYETTGEFFAAFAAESGLGRNYPIVLYYKNEKAELIYNELFPEY